MNAKVLIVGVGGLGSPAAFYLAAAGMGTIGLVDSDRVELSNLQRQIIHLTKDVDVPKVTSGAQKLTALNPEITVKTYYEQLKPDTAGQIIRGYDFVIDATDNFNAKFLLNDTCVQEKVPLAHGGVLRFNGQIMTIVPGESACLRCIFENPPPPQGTPTAAEAGILGATAGLLGTIQATEAIKYITGAGTLLSDTILFFDTLSMTFTKQMIRRNLSCVCCGER